MTTDAQFDALARFHRALVEEILKTRPAYLSEPFTVAEIYQNLVPYRTHRDRIGVEMNGDYEDALLRLLAGEGEFLQIESEHARNEIASELLSPNPNTGLFREFAAVDVRLNPLRMPRDLPDPVRGRAPAGFEPPDVSLDMVPEPSRHEAPHHEAPHQEAARHEPPRPAPAATPSAPPAPRASQPSAAAAPATSRHQGSCPWCREGLPARATLNFCPQCGADLHTRPCAACGEELEAGWRFCVACGTPTGDVG